MELDQVSAVEFPDSSSVSGVRNDRNGRFVAWGRKSGSIALFEGSRSRSFRIAEAVGVVGVGFDTHGDAQAMVETVNKSSGRQDVILVSVPTTGAKPLASVEVDARLLQAERAGTRWYMSATLADSALAVFRRDSDGSVRPIRIVRSRTDAGEGVPKLHLSADSDELLLTRADSPFNVERIDSIGRSLGRSAPLDDERVRTAIDSMPEATWVSLPAIPLARGYIQTIADLRSAERILILSGRDGRVISARRFSIPLGFVDSDIPAQLLCAVRTLDTRELVCYRWK